MKISRPVGLLILALVILLLAGIQWGPWLFSQIITPLALVVWLFLRFSVLSIDQQYYWGALIFVGVIVLIRFLLQKETSSVPAKLPDSNEMMNRITYWRSVFTFIDQDLLDERMLKQELTHLLLSLYATKQQDLASFRLFEALHHGEIPIPEAIRAYLFVEEPLPSGRLKRWARAWQRQVRRWTGQAAAENERMIDLVLGFIETNLERKDDDRKFNSNED
jgi:hypothetical protein